MGINPCRLPQACEGGGEAEVEFSVDNFDGVSNSINNKTKVMHADFTKPPRLRRSRIAGIFKCFTVSAVIVISGIIYIVCSPGVELNYRFGNFGVAQVKNIKVIGYFEHCTYLSILSVDLRIHVLTARQETSDGFYLSPEKFLPGLRFYPKRAALGLSRLNVELLW